MATSRAPGADFSDAAQADLAQARELLREVHPAAVSGADPAFTRWLDQGYAPALQRARRVTRQEQVLPVLRSYLTGFRDGHVAAWDPSATQAWTSWAGWAVQWRGDALLVTHTAASWPRPLPPVGASLRACDGVPVQQYIAQHIAPFVDRRMELESVRAWLATLLSYRSPAVGLLEDAPASHCSFEARGVTSQYTLHWQPPQASAVQPGEPARMGVEAWGPRRFWVHAQQFRADRLAPDEAERAMAQVRAIPADAELVVFDTRGNQGGNSLYGHRLVEALLRRATPVVQPDAHALWRPSRTALATFERAAREERERAGPDSPGYRWLARISDFLHQAHRSTGPDVLVSDAALGRDVLPAHSEGEAFTGRIVLVTDKYCASACLDFADLVRAVPGALHVGEPTSADTLYMDVTVATLPSGLQMVVPQKQWVNRPRGSNVPHVPHHRYDGDIRDTAALRAWLATLLP